MKIIAKKFGRYFKLCVSLYQTKQLNIKIMLQEINKGIERALETINYELSFGDLANQERIAKYNKYITDMNELKTTI
tara:strand:+ start:614 stop:844 length:231 start_codon:yes stop_codon:yes gene_type:complete